MSKIVLVAIVVLVFFWLLRRALGGRGGGARAAPPPATPELVACAHCGVHLPQGEAVVADDPGEPAARRYFCTEEHRKLGAR